jgi:hypothetical protein
VVPHGGIGREEGGVRGRWSAGQGVAGVGRDLGRRRRYRKEEREDVLRVGHELVLYIFLGWAQARRG